MTSGDLIPRTCTELSTEECDADQVRVCEPLSVFRDVPAYVLLGEPGSGKSEAFEQECQALGAGAERISARRFAKAKIESHLEWREKTLFIDGLDETRAGGLDSTSALDEIQSRLEALGRPSFRISCRSADWLGPVDRVPLSEVSPDGRIMTLSLDASDRSAVLEYLKSRLSDRDPAAFVHEVVSSGLDFMLNNPLLLGLLVAVALDDDDGPSTRREVFQRSCRTLAVEHNPSHPRSRQSRSAERVLAAAGRICAIQLLASKEGFSLASAHAEVDFVRVADVISDIAAASGLEDRDVQEVFATKLFMGAAEQHVVPFHRHVAEYLGAAHIADLIARGVVSAGRIFQALISNVEGRIVTDLRGLAAWLCTHSAGVRRLLIEADPVGMGLYGDVGELPVEDRRRLMNALVESARPEHLWGYSCFDQDERRYRDSTALSFRGLCKPDMAETVEKYLGAGERDDVPGHILEFMLRALSEAEDGWLDQLSSLVPHARQLALGETTQPDVRLAALVAFARLERSQSMKAATLSEALDAVREGRFADPDDRVGASLLRLLYPTVIAPSEIWAYASLLRRGPVNGEGWDFWRHVLCDETPIGQLPQLLDGFAEEAERLWPIVSSAFANEVPFRLLNRALREVGRGTEPERLYRWIAAVVANYERRSRNTDETAELSAWLATNEQATLQLRSIWVARSVSDEAGVDKQYFLKELLLANYPRNFVSWCVRAARERQRAEPEVARAFVREAYYALPKMREQFGTSVDDLRTEIDGDKFLTEILDAFTSRNSTSAESDGANEGWRRRLAESEAQLERERQERQRDWSSHLRDHIQELRTNSFSAPILHTLARAYFGLLMEVNDDDLPVDRVADLIGDDAEILEAVVDALRNAPARADVPSVERTAELTAGSKHDWLAYPVLAGLAIRQAEGSLDPSWLSAEQRRQAVAIAATAPVNPDQQPSWAVEWLHKDPTLVLDVLRRCAVASIRKGDTHLSMLNWLLEVEGLNDELCDFRLGLLRSMSVRMPHAQLQLFDYLMGLVLQHPDAGPLTKLATRKLASTSMTDAQRVRWLTLDALLWGGDTLRFLEEFLEHKPASAAELAQFLSVAARRSSFSIESVEDAANVGALIRIVGRAFPPRDWGTPGKAVRIGPAERMSSLISSWINELGSQSTADAGDALDTLIGDDHLNAWRGQLEFVRDKQRRLHSDTAHAQMSVVDVLGLLRDGPPANVADLSALLCDHLNDLSTRIQGDNSELWSQFWAGDRSQSPSQVKHEDTCRDALLAMMRSRLPDGVDAQPEGQYAADKRADIRVSSKSFNVPIEIKKNTHRNLWTAIEDQLIAKYTVDPETGGYGIYLVLWFGPSVDGYPRHATDGDRPGTPDELARRLSETLSFEQLRRVSVVVLDVTKPAMTGAG